MIALERRGASSTEVLVDLNRAMWQTMTDSIRRESPGRTLLEEELLKQLRKIALIGKRHVAENEGLQ